jgi:dsRNA-specific ribonuclease
MTEDEKRTLAWVGDAVLALFARKWILAQNDIPKEARAERFIQMTSNKFLSAMGEPTAMEAEIGAIYEKSGLEAAFEYIDSKFIPVFLKQRNNQVKSGSYRKKSKAL